MNELIQMIQTDPELWELIERLKNQDEELEDFLLGLAQMFAVEFRELERSDLIFTFAHVPGKKAPILITNKMMKNLKKICI